MPVALAAADRALLSGSSGAGAALAMRLVVRAAEALGADQLIPITRAHVDSCLYHGQASLDFVHRLSEGEARVSVPTTLNVGTVDLLHPELWRGDEAMAARGRELMEAYRAIGCRPTFTCAPYQVPDARPAFGEQVAWGESNAIAFCNSVLGARTERYGDFIDVACAIVGRAPAAGLHRTDGRRAVLVLRLAADVPAALRESEVLYPVLGIVLGRRTRSRVAAIDGLPAHLHEDRLKAICAAAASSGAVAMFHVVGSTPEAATLDEALQGGEPEETIEVGLGELRAARDSLSDAAAVSGSPIGAVSLGTPHASLDELRAIAEELDGERVNPGVELLVSTGRSVLEVAEQEGIARRLRDARAELLVDTCSYLGPILRPNGLPTMTDSAKWAYYAPGNIGATVVFGSRTECLRSAVLGRVWRDGSLWGDR